MKRIKLTQGYTTAVDDQLYPFLKRFSWYISKKGRKVYARTKINGHEVFMHKLILNARKNQQVDHINGDPLDNREKNLRVCTGKQNSQNRKKTYNRNVGLKGVAWNKEKKKWRAYITVDRKFKHLGYFIDKTEAGQAYDSAARKYFGEFAWTNYVDNQ